MSRRPVNTRQANNEFAAGERGAVRHLLGVVASGILVGLYCAGTVVAADMVNINTASKDELQTLNGIGPAYSEDIVQYRNANGDFESVDELTVIHGIGDGKVKNFSDRATVGEEDDDTAEDDDGSNGTSTEETSDDTSQKTSENDDDDDGDNPAPTAIEKAMDLSLTITPENPVAGSPVQFKANGYIGDSPSQAATYSWNFGDMVTDKGEEVTHTYERGGTYTIVLNAETLEQERTVRRTLSVADPQLTITAATTSPEGTVTIGNDLSERVSLTGWELRSGGERVTLPERSYLAADARITVSADTADLFISRTGVSLISPNGEVVDKYQFSRSTGGATKPEAAPASVDRTAQTREVSDASQAAADEKKNHENNRSHQQHNESTSSNAGAASRHIASIGASSDNAAYQSWLFVGAGTLAAAVAGALLFWPEVGTLTQAQAGAGSEANGEIGNEDDDIIAESRAYTVRDISGHSSHTEQ